MTLVSIHDASKWASKHLQKEVSLSNISYLIQYGKVKKYGENGTTLVDLDDLQKYYESYNGKREINWKNHLGNDLNWSLSFDHLREKDTTKHVHRLHPYKGKFIPQLVEYFIDNHTDNFKKETYFKTGDIILDPFLGSGTTIIQALEMGIHSIGIDISDFNCMISECKASKYNDDYLVSAIRSMLSSLKDFENKNKINEFDNVLLEEIGKFNSHYFPGHEFRYNLNQNYIDEDKLAAEKEKEFLPIYLNLVKEYSIKLKQEKSTTFLDQWYIENVRREIEQVFSVIKQEKDIRTKKLLALILSRTIRSCRATTHSDLATLREPQLTTYYCYKHKKICKPIFSIRKMLERYSMDTLKRIREFDKLRKPVLFSVLSGDSRVINIFEKVEKKNPEFYKILKDQKISGIFSSPPYVGQIDYHEQHAYAYDLFKFPRKDKFEIGPLSKGQGIEARKSYVQGIVGVLNNCRPFLKDNFNIFLVANDKFNIYPTIAEQANLRIVNQFKRPVLNRTERDRNPYSEIIFHLKEICNDPIK
jgi:hypothetical protein